MQVHHYQEPISLSVDQTADGPTLGRWIPDIGTGAVSAWQCPAYIAGGELFTVGDGWAEAKVPGKGYGYLDDGTPDSMAQWYRVRDGRPALIGIPRALRAVME